MSIRSDITCSGRVTCRKRRLKWLPLAGLDSQEIPKCRRNRGSNPRPQYGSRGTASESITVRRLGTTMDFLSRIGWSCIRRVRQRPTMTTHQYPLRVQPLPRVTGRQLIAVLRRLGWLVVVQKGSHVHLKHAGRPGPVTVPVHSGETIGPALLRSILAQAGITADELRAEL